MNLSLRMFKISPSMQQKRIQCFIICLCLLSEWILCCHLSDAIHRFMQAKLRSTCWHFPWCHVIICDLSALQKPWSLVVGSPRIVERVAVLNANKRWWCHLFQHFIYRCEESEIYPSMLIVCMGWQLLSTCRTNAVTCFLNIFVFS